MYFLYNPKISKSLRAVPLKMITDLLQISQVMELSVNKEVSFRYSQTVMGSLQSHRHIYSPPYHRSQDRLSRAWVAAFLLFNPPLPKLVLPRNQLACWPQGRFFPQKVLAVVVRLCAKAPENPASDSSPPTCLCHKREPKSNKNHTAYSKRHKLSLISWSQDPFSSLIF